MLFALLLVVGGALYIRWRWGRSPQAYRAMIALAICYFVAGTAAAMSLMWATERRAEPVASAVPAPVALASPDSEAPVSSPEATPSGPLQLSEYDPSRAVRPDPKLTPGEALGDVSKAEVCTTGWERRDVTESDRKRVRAEYPDWQRMCACADGRPKCCEVDHLIPLELGGSNDIKNLWPQPEMPKPGYKEKNSLENTLKRLVCNGTMTLADAQHCIASDWVKCWETYYAVPRYGAEWAANRR